MADESSFHLVMPFVVCQSKGGPYDDEAYVAGYEAGALAMALATAPKTDTEPRRLDTPYHSDNRPQLDLIAMKHGYSASFEEAEVDGWVWVTVTPISDRL
jgi:hypothetical protein